MAQSQRPTVIAPAIRFSVVFLVLCGLVYPLVTAGVARVLFPTQAKGSLVEVNGTVVGSELLGQPFRAPYHFWGRVAPNFALSNLGPLNPELSARVARETATWGTERVELPTDLYTRSGSGVDPHISPETARAQVPRVAAATGISTADLNGLIDQYTSGRTLGLFGEPRVNVLLLNLAVDKARGGG